jgi:hypothetical protein
MACFGGVGEGIDSLKKRSKIRNAELQSCAEMCLTTQSMAAHLDPFCAQILKQRTVAQRCRSSAFVNCFPR